jgi:hypothetical protein
LGEINPAHFTAIIQGRARPVGIKSKELAKRPAQDGSGLHIW